MAASRARRRAWCSTMQRRWEASRCQGLLGSHLPLPGLDPTSTHCLSHTHRPAIPHALPLPQFFTAADPTFQAMVDRWEADGAVMRWAGPVGSLRDGSFVADGAQPRYVARGGMRRLASHLAAQASAALREAQGGGGAGGMASECDQPVGAPAARHGHAQPWRPRTEDPCVPHRSVRPPAGMVEVRRPQWVSDAQHTKGGWQLAGRGRDQGRFDAVVIAQ